MKAFLFATALVAGTFSTANAADDTPVTTQSGTPVVMTTTTSSTPMARRGLFSRLRGRTVTPMTATTMPTVVTPAAPATTTPSPTPMPSKVTSTEKTDKGVVQASGSTTVESTTTSTKPVATTMTSTKPVRRMGFMSRMRMNRMSY